MPIIKGLVTEEGGLVTVSLGWSRARVRKLRREHRRVPARLEAIALLDTGAEVTCLDSRLIEELELPFDGVVLAKAPALGDVTFSAKYAASLTIIHTSGRTDDHLVINDIAILELPLDLIGYQAVIGRDVLSRCLFLYNGIGERFALKY